MSPGEGGRPDGFPALGGSGSLLERRHPGPGGCYYFFFLPFLLFLLFLAMRITTFPVRRQSTRR